MPLKRNVGILTFYYAVNYGAVLQAVALSQTIAEMGCDVSFINYQSKPIWLMHHKSLKDVKGVQQLAHHILYAKYDKIKAEKFTEFVTSFAHINNVSVTSVSDIPETYDIILVGSDQVWNHELLGCDSVYLLERYEGSALKASYAASFGVNHLPEELRAIYRRCLSDFDWLSVRERSAATIVEKELGLHAEVVLDPVLLRDAQQWRLVEKPVAIPNRYIFVYMLFPDENLMSLAQQVSHDTGLPIVILHKGRRHPRPEGLNLHDSSPEEFLFLIDNADFILTNSFHGFCFSVLFKRNVIVHLLRTSTRNNRILDLANDLGIMQQIVFDNDSISSYSGMNYAEIDKKLHDIRNDSLRYLRKLLRQIDK